MPETNYLTEKDLSLLKRLKVTPQEKMFLEEIWKKLPNDKSEGTKGRTKILFIMHMLMITSVGIMTVTIFDKSWAPLANLASVTLILFYVVYMIALSVMLVMVAATDVSSEKTKEKKLKFVNRDWIELLPRRFTFNDYMQSVIGWLGVLSTIMAGYLFFGLIMIGIKVVSWVLIVMIRTPIEKALAEGTEIMSQACTEKTLQVTT